MRTTPYHLLSERGSGFLARLLFLPPLVAAEVEVGFDALAVKPQVVDVGRFFRVERSATPMAEHRTSFVKGLESGEEAEQVKIQDVFMGLHFASSPHPRPQLTRWRPPTFPSWPLGWMGGLQRSSNFFTRELALQGFLKNNASHPAVGEKRRTHNFP